MFHICCHGRQRCWLARLILYTSTDTLESVQDDGHCSNLIAKALHTSCRKCGLGCNQRQFILSPTFISICLIISMLQLNMTISFSYSFSGFIARFLRMNCCVVSRDTFEMAGITVVACSAGIQWTRNRTSLCGILFFFQLVARFNHNHHFAALFQGRKKPVTTVAVNSFKLAKLEHLAKADF